MTADIVVVGANGFIGSRLVKSLSSRGVVKAVSRRPVEEARAEWIPLSADGHVDWAPILSPGATVIWAAGNSTPASSSRSAAAELASNIAPLVRLLEATRGAPPLRIVFLSTGGAIYGDVMGNAATEKTVIEPRSYYSAGKAAAEAFLCAWAHQEGHDAVIFRASNVYGSGQPYRPGFGIIPTAFHAIRHDVPVAIRGDGEATRDYLHVEDLASLVAEAAARTPSPGATTYNASSGQGLSLNALFERIEHITGRRVPRTYSPAPAFDVKRVVLDNGLASAAYAWRPSIDIESGLRQAWAASE